MRKRLLLVIPAVPLLLCGGFWNPPRDSTSYDSARLIETGLDLERRGDFSGAERNFLEAARFDRLYQPAWTLANFYFRRSDPDHFWHWTRAALAVGRRDLGALFDLCWQMPDGGEKLWSFAMPDSKAALNEYLYYLMTTGRWPNAAVTARRIADLAGPDDKALLMSYCELAMAHGDRAGANQVWKAMCSRGVLPFAAGSILTNGDFRVTPSGRGFDWRIPSPALAGFFRPGEATFTLNGFQRDTEVLLQQPLALDPNAGYQLVFEYKTDGFHPDPGIHWVAGNATSGGIASPDWATGTFDFRGSAASLELVYQRPVGSTMAEGTLSVRKVTAVLK